MVTTDGLVGFLSGGKENDGVAAPALVEDGIGCYVPADRGYDSNDFRRKPVEYNRERYKKRSYIERLFGKIKENRRLAVRYEKSDLNFLAFILIAFLKILLC